ncbi:MAG TPA: hypothetical protein G4N92_06460 [Anaerolineae bacterium]|nr:hypothetical protein [Anaerolineae bacterium]
MKAHTNKLCAVVTYSYTMAHLAEEAGVDMILVGDSATRVFSGLPDHRNMSLEQIFYHTQAVARACKRVKIMVDLPQATMEEGIEATVKASRWLIEEGKAHSIKVEGSSQLALDIVAAIAHADIPVVGHFTMLDIKDDRVHAKQQTNQEAVYQAMLALGKEFEIKGASTLLLSKIRPSIAAAITRSVDIPTIGIGSGPDCDGQILVLEDLLGLTYRNHPYYVKQYAQLGKLTSEAIRSFISEVHEGKYPDKSHSQPRQQE